MPVNVVSGEVNRTWRFDDSAGGRHEVSLYHHPLTGARAAMIDYEELDGSLGTSSIFHGPITDLPFALKTGEHGVIRIRHDGLLGFSYECRVNNVLLSEATSTTSGQAVGATFGHPAPTTAGAPLFEVDVTDAVVTLDHASPKESITWCAISRALEKQEDESRGPA